MRKAQVWTPTTSPPWIRGWVQKALTRSRLTRWSPATTLSRRGFPVRLVSLPRIDSKDEVKVRYGPDNGEVQGAVLASRLLWALGFGADQSLSRARDLPGLLHGSMDEP
jgi:hypothetical protein